MKITDVIAHPLRAVPAKMQRTGTRDFPAFELVIVEIHTDSGVQGWGECLGRVGAIAYAGVVERVLKPLLIGQNPLDIARHWDRMRRALSGRSGGMLLEAIAGCDIALWDIAGKIAGLPIHRLLGSMGRTHLDCYASSINWASDEEAAEETRAALALGFRQIKVKIGKPVARAIERCRQIRDIAGPDIRLMVDSNWAYDVDETVQVARGLERLDYFWFEEPIPCEDIEGYRLLARKLDIRIAAGESDFTAWQVNPDGSIVQVTPTWSITGPATVAPSGASGSVTGTATSATIRDSRPARTVTRAPGSPR